MQACDGCGRFGARARLPFVDGLCGECQLANVLRCEHCRRPFPGPDSGWADPQPPVACAARHIHDVCEGCEEAWGDACPKADEVLVAKVVMA